MLPIKKFTVLLAVLLLGIGGGNAEESHRAARILKDGPIDGIALGLHHPLPGTSHAGMIAEIAGTGTRWISLVLPYYQRDIEATEMNVPDPRTPSFEAVESALRVAREHRLRVMVFPIVLLQDDRGSDWRGQLQPSDRAAWFANYGKLLTRLARMSEDAGAEVFCVGSELVSLQPDRGAWTGIIKGVRREFGGALIYSANWDAFDDLGFLDQLDLVGVTSYFELSERSDPDVGELLAAWRGIRHELLEWQRGHGTPMVFTEVGYASVDGCASQPWNYTRETAVDPGEQRDCYEAFTRTWWEEPQLAGTIFYEWFGEGGLEDRGYTPKGKPALEVLQRWLQRPVAPRAQVAP